jgi:hypothetical protein
MRLRGRIAVEHGRARHIALLQAHRETVLQVDGGEEDHYVAVIPETERSEVVRNP